MNTEAVAVPAGACDSHIHFYDRMFPAAPAAVLTPPDASVAEYRALQRSTGLERVVVVQPTTYGLDNRCQLAAVAEFGDDARAVAVVDDATTAAELRRLTEAGVRGARFHMLPGGAVGWDAMGPVAARVADHGWHIQLQLDGHQLQAHLDELLSLPTALVVDHVGRYMPPVLPGDPALDALHRLVDGGRTWVKLSAPYESAPDPTHRYERVSAVATSLVARAPERMLWGSNWPHPGQDAPPSPSRLVELLVEWIPDPRERTMVLVDNPATLYGFDVHPPPTN